MHFLEVLLKFKRIYIVPSPCMHGLICATSIFFNLNSADSCTQDSVGVFFALFCDTWWLNDAGAVALLLLLAVSLLCAYELSAVYVTAGRSASSRFSPSAFFFGVSAIAMGINMLFICKMVFHGEWSDLVKLFSFFVLPLDIQMWLFQYFWRMNKNAYPGCSALVICISSPLPLNLYSLLGFKDRWKWWWLCNSLTWCRWLFD